MLTFTFTSSIPKASDLSEVHGSLSSYYFKQTRRGKDDYKTILILEDGSRFWTDVISKETADSVLVKQGAEVRSYIDPHSTYVPIDGAIKTYGLWIDGQQIQSLDEALGNEKLVQYFCFPSIAVFAAIAAILIHRRNKAKYTM